MRTRLVPLRGIHRREVATILVYPHCTLQQSRRSSSDVTHLRGCNGNLHEVHAVVVSTRLAFGARCAVDAAGRVQLGHSRGEAAASGDGRGTGGGGWGTCLRVELSCWQQLQQLGEEGRGAEGKGGAGVARRSAARGSAERGALRRGAGGARRREPEVRGGAGRVASARGTVLNA